MKKFILYSLFLNFWGLTAQQVNTLKINIESNLANETTVNTKGTEPSVSVYEVTMDMLNDIKDQSELLKINKSQANILKRADSYFDKMWYAQAAELYELALQEPENYSFEVLKRTGDAYYFITDMEKSFYWYDMLFNKYKGSMDAEAYFKYAHTLKSFGQYSKAKRYMRIYRKMEDRSLDFEEDAATLNETVLDNIIKDIDRFSIKNLAINSEYSDFSPMYFEADKVVYSSAKDTSIFTTRKYKWNNQPFLDLYVSKMNSESRDLNDALKFSKKINSKFHEASVAFSPDNKTMYFTRNNYGKKLRRDKNGINHLKIYKSIKVGEEWSSATELPFNSDSYSAGHPALSPDGKQLYFVSDMPGSIGESDIFVVDVLENNSFSEPRNLGPKINTPQREMFPFITNEKLYFSSEGHVGLGGLDVFEAAYGVDGFQEIKNVGKPINSNKDDFSFIISEENQTGYFASNRDGGKGDDDIYSFEKLILEKVNNSAIAGVITERVTGDYMPMALISLLDENNIKLKEIETAEDGTFVFEDLEGDKKYRLRVNKKQYFEDEQEIITKLNETSQLDISLERLEELIVIENGIRKLKTDMIYFDFDKFNVRSDAAQELNKLVEMMNEYPGMVIKIESHTDSRGAKDYNRVLSDKRAKSTRDFIIAKGIAPNRIESAIGYGEDQLINECDGSVKCSSEKHELNRRSEFIIVKI
jgi:outer membrane protein OmpA-like peptidoglycan-associated protein/DNA-binding beta-propeller fold protein YncE